MSSWRLMVGRGRRGVHPWGGPVQIGCFKNTKFPQLETLEPGILSIALGGKISFFTCLSVPLLDVIFFAMFELIGSPLIAEAIWSSSCLDSPGFAFRVNE